MISKLVPVGDSEVGCVSFVVRFLRCVVQVEDIKSGTKEDVTFEGKVGR